MEQDDLAHRIPRKRSRSPSVASTVVAASVTERDGARPHAPKRLRRSRDAEVEEHAKKAMAGANPLGRRVLKREAKKARQAAKRRERAARGMEVDRDEEMGEGLEATFMG